MKTVASVLTILNAACAPFSGFRTQTAASGKHKKAPTIVSVLEQLLGMVEKTVETAEEAVPEEKYAFVPNRAGIC